MNVPEHTPKINRRAMIAATVAAPAAMVAGTAQAETPEAQIMHHVWEIERIMRETAPEGANLKGFQFMIVDGVREDTVWGSALTKDYQLTHLRPALHSGWRESTVHSEGG